MTSGLGLGTGDWDRLSTVAWAARGCARIHEHTRVGAAVLCRDGSVHPGCNVEHVFRSHDVHAEVNALGTMVANRGDSARAVLVVADCERFTPCGACMDWIFELGGPECLVGFQREVAGAIEIRTAQELMPFYPMF